VYSSRWRAIFYLGDFMRHDADLWRKASAERLSVFKWEFGRAGEYGATW